MRALSLLLFLGFLKAQALAPGDKAPLLEARDSYGRPVDFRGSYVVLWFYPKAKSPGCTAQAKRYSELHGEFQRLGVRVYGVSHDPAAEQCNFVERLALKGGMIPDPEGRLARAYGVRNLFGFYSRDTILLNPEGRIERIWRGVNPFKDADTVLAYLKERLR
ncbi:Alkyl hydroperoxide reductase/ Thiol specific antioxidant/ Mal allergen [Thermus sp. CCB_US3_UF1]|uniref:peroxiredoxin n=1 Tax=Thermus sp. CCB_US3_UF1 TaxID=1111069 RepID=UPI000238931F|nr:peroxiredoxin [Thermus sp. CCB_US3_UF1]AEV16620.1 Alkyl hydroperoxide reductase/ Thiol specific antioxidant/ Mal allergen [Thermus sp. CCB_US3_UF1]